MQIVIQSARSDVLVRSRAILGCSLQAQHALAAAPYVVTTVPPVGDFDRDPVLTAAAPLLGQLASGGRLQWVAYISSTGVYGDHAGGWVNERCVPSAVCAVRPKMNSA